MNEINNSKALSIVQVVDRIINQRKKERLPIIQEKKKQFENISEVLQDFKNSNMENVKDMAPLLYETIKKIDFDNLHTMLSKLIKRAAMLEERFSRDNVSIALVGHARMGKSTILQSITELDDDVIPTSSYSDCTGAVSIIQNSNGPFEMDIEYYSDKEFLDAVNAHLNKLGIEETLTSIEQIPKLKIDINGEGEDEKKAFVDDYIKGYSSYSDCLSNNPPKHFSNKSEVIEYVAKYKLFDINEQIPQTYIEQHYPIEDIEDKNGNVVQKKVKFTKFVTIKKVYIKNRYEYGDVGKIIAIDTIGLGNAYTINEDTKKMQDVLANETDVAVYNFKVREDGENQFPTDIKNELNIIYDTLADYHPEKWIAFNLNISAKDNLPPTYYHMCKELVKKVSSSIFGKANKPLVMATSCNAMDKEEVRNKIVIPVLGIIEGNINYIDDSFMVDFNKKATEFFEKYNTICDNINEAMAEMVCGTENYLTIFKQNYAALELRIKLTEYVNRLEKEISKPCSSITNDLKPQVESLHKFVPKKSDIVIELNKMDTQNAHPINVFNTLMDNLLADVLNFMKTVSANSVIKIQEKVKNKIIRILYEDGLLKNISVRTASKEMPTKEWLKAFCEEHLYSYHRLYSAIDSLLNFRMSIEGYMYSKCIMACEPLRSTERYTLPPENTETEDIAQYIWQALMNSIREVKRNITKAFMLEDSILNSAQNNKDITMPNLLLWCMSDTFVRELIFTEGGKELETFYYEKATTLWGDKISDLLSTNRIVRELQEKIAVMNSYNDKNSFQIRLNDGTKAKI